ncbi:SLC13 family permease [Evansella cellulosilytica]|uniref:TrkA-C domain protein n=1 Tax=Evansella cellulosilytica (strain ATCC 21833 / DSM 2522 / FERM P-1141 / JCM 9156 / N-4) TaxID=649639 RepID=E6TTX5_EVAC2|nr:SLC13 family permease [Evansella cellulosilytica]ADU32006.1 TrkA-C domain protein [Evansella cellulosilytica DSM 2522]
MTFEITFVIIVVLLMLVSLAKEIAKPAFIVFIALASLLLSGILSPADALRGFSNEGMLTVALLFIVAGAVKQSGVLNQIVTKSLGGGKSPRKSLVQMMGPMAGLSAFLNNTPIVVMFTPVVRKWCKERNIAPSKFLIPLSYATIFGGTLTLIGTSTNLVIHGFMLEQGLDGFSMFQLAIVSLPAGILGIIYMVTIGYKLLPSRRTSEESFEESSREYLSEAYVEANSPLVGKTIEEAGLRELSGLYLIEIIRNGERTASVPSYKKLMANDKLIFTGVLSTIVDLQNIKGLRVETGTNLKLEDLQNGSASLMEAVVSHQSSLAQKTVKESKFRSKYGAGVVAVHRADVRINDKVGDIVLKPGDTLLLLSNKDFERRWTNSRDFYLISPLKEPEVVDSRKSIIALSTIISMIALAAFNILPMFQSALLAVIVLFFTKTITFEGAKKYIQFDVLLLIACTIGIGIALDQTGAAALIAQSFIHITKGVGIIGAVIAIYLLTTLFTEVITNNAAAVLMVPISLAIANQLSVDPMSFFVTIAIAASASFATPIGYQANLIVYGPGGYRFSDYLKVGIPLNILYLIVTVIIVYFVWLV